MRKRLLCVYTVTSYNYIIIISPFQIFFFFFKWLMAFFFFRLQNS